MYALLHMRGCWGSKQLTSLTQPISEPGPGSSLTICLFVSQSVGQERRELEELITLAIAPLVYSRAPGLDVSVSAISLLRGQERGESEELITMSKPLIQGHISI